MRNIFCDVSEMKALDVLDMEKSIHISSFLGFFESITVVSLIFFILGFLFIFIEFLIPGFGIFGGTGIVFLIIGVVLVSQSIIETIIASIVIFLLLVIGVLTGFKSLLAGEVSKSVILNSNETKESGYVGVKDFSKYLNKEGVALTSLRPSGTGEFEGERVDIVTEGDFIEVNEKIKIFKVDGSRVVVKKIK